MTDMLITTWTDVCALADLIPGRGRAALLNGQQIALFRFPFDDELFAVSNFDPFSKAFVISRGIVGTKGDVRKVASPIFKQSFDLRTGECLDDPDVSLDTYDIRLVDGRIEIGVT